ncbi:MAG: DUF5710 domain-containing protein [Acutalibacteraceae bacterium]|nr:DUF5710 domain-containing protein [Acutalibacteraceae bacterium]
MALYLEVPYSEKDEAKKLGARWNPKVKKWFVNVPRKKYQDDFPPYNKGTERYKSS